ncbi:MAG TPA: non-homologous end-joining DNA ligase [Chloroflexota bacterium]
MLATLTHSPFSDPSWLFERKLDGERVLAYRAGSEVHLYSRNHKPLDAAYPELVEALAQQPSADFIVDGEVVAFDSDRTSFARLQGRIGLRGAAAKASDIEVIYYLFDLPRLDGRPLTGQPLRERKRLLREAFQFRDPLRFTEHREAEGEAMFVEACRQGWEGLIAKRADSPYVSKRSTDWLKFKCSAQQELVVGGFTDPQRSRVGFGALLLGYYQDGRLRYAGKVGTGYDTRTLLDLRERLGRLEIDRPAFAEPVRERGAHWVRPELVAEVAFTEWTGDGKLRHPRFLGLRRDKPPQEVVREDA